MHLGKAGGNTWNLGEKLGLAGKAGLGPSLSVKVEERLTCWRLASTEFRNKKSAGVPGKPDWLEEKKEWGRVCLWQFASQSQTQAKKTSTPRFSKQGENHLFS